MDCGRERLPQQDSGRESGTTGQVRRGGGGGVWEFRGAAVVHGQVDEVRCREAGAARESVRPSGPQVRMCGSGWAAERAVLTAADVFPWESALRSVAGAAEVGGAHACQAIIGWRPQLRVAAGCHFDPCCLTSLS